LKCTGHVTVINTTKHATKKKIIKEDKIKANMQKKKKERDTRRTCLSRVLN